MFLKTAYSTQWALYILGLHKDIQNNLRNALLESNILKVDLLNNTLKEVLRMFPLAPFLARILPSDTYLTSHIIPANVCYIKEFLHFINFHIYFYLL